VQDPLPDREQQDLFRDSPDSAPQALTEGLLRVVSVRCRVPTERDLLRADSARCRVPMEQDLLRVDSAPQARVEQDLFRDSPDSALQALTEQDLFRDKADSAPQALTEQDLLSRDRMAVPLPDRYRTVDQIPVVQSLSRMIQMNLSSASLTGKARTKNNPDLLYFSPLL